MKIKVLHIVGGSTANGAYIGASILHKALLDQGVSSKLLNDTCNKKDQIKINSFDKSIIFIIKNFLQILMNKFFIISEKILKSIFLHSPRETFTLGFFGFDITKVKEYKEADIVHIHWLNQGFINLKSLSKIDKPVVWTMRDMWAFTGGSHYSMDFEKYENSYLSQVIQKYKKKKYNKNFQFVAVSNWLKNKAKRSLILADYKVMKIDNNIELKNFDLITKKEARSILNINTKKQIILYGAQNPQSKRKGWNIFVNSLKKLEKSSFFLLIFGSFWSQEVLDKIGIEYKVLGFINNRKILNATYRSADIFVASSIQDAWPKTFAEAMYCGAPTICFNNTSIAEIVDHKINGYVVQEFNPTSLKEGIVWISKEIKKNNLMSINATNKISNFSSKIIAQKYIDLYKNLLNV